MIIARISRARWVPNVFVRTTLEKTRGLLEFILCDITPHYSVAKIAVKQHPTAPEGVAYQIAD